MIDLRDFNKCLRKIELNSKSTGKWELNKKGLRKAGGSVNYDLNEKTKTTIINPCYICPDGMKTMAVINETKTVEGKVSGLSNKSVFEGQQVEDCRAKIMFLSDDTYYILVKAVTEKGTLKTTVEKKNNAPCASDKKDEPEEPRTNEIDIPLVVVLGPYNETFPAMKTADGTLVFSQDGEPVSLMCADETDGSSFRVCNQIFSKLYHFGWGSAIPEPDLAEKCVGNADATEWTCTLRKGVVFSNGATLDSGDVVATFSAGMDYKNVFRKGNTGAYQYFKDLFGPKVMNEPAQ